MPAENRFKLAPQLPTLLYLRSMQHPNFYYHQEVANLLWCAASTSLLDAALFPDCDLADSNWFDPYEPSVVHWLKALDAKPEALKAFLDDGVKRPLGKTFERYLSFWLRNYPYTEFLAENVQVKSEQRTIGEFDFIFRDLRSGLVYHMEAACKFYLGTGKGALDSWIGPSARDRLHLKVDTLHRQLNLSKRPEGRESLARLGIELPRPLLLTRGYLFHHYRKLFRATSPRGVHPNYQAGWWLRSSELADFFSGEGLYAVLPKSDWLATWHSVLPEDAIATARQMPEKCRSYMADGRKSLMVVQIEMASNGYLEQSRGFVVSDQWPEY